MTGRFVFGDRPSPIAQVTAHVLDTPKPPSAHAEVSPALDALLMRCLAKSPDERPSASTLERSLRNLARRAPASLEDIDAWWEAHTASDDDDIASAPTGLDRGMALAEAPTVEAAEG